MEKFKPMERSQGMKDFLQTVGLDFETPVLTNTCFSCKQPVRRFNSDLSKREFTISGLCQACQDVVFNAEEE